MKNQEILNQEELDQQLPTLKGVFTTIYSGKTKQISYSDTYNLVYKLCKRGMSQQILKQLINASISHFQSIIAKLDVENLQINGYLKAINQINEAIERITEVLLYIQSNFVNDPKRAYNSIKDMLQSKFFEQLCKDKNILKKISEKIVQVKTLGIQNCQLIQVLNNLDEKQVFYPQYLMPIYIQKRSQYLKKQFAKLYEQRNTKQFFNSVKKLLKQERQWLQKKFQRVKGKKLIQESMKKIYDNSLTQIKQKVYSQKKQQLFKTHVLDFLQLLNQKNEEKQLNTFNEWYINEIKKKVSAIDRSNNENFLKKFISQYLEISQSLGEIKNYNISYKATFFLQHWINQQKMHLSKRLSVFFEKLILSNSTNNGDLANFAILFKFLKQKDFFERQFRRGCAFRMIYNEAKSKTKLQHDMIQQMSTDCGIDWVHKLKLLKMAAHDAEQMSQYHTPIFKALVFEDICWPFEKLKKEINLPSSLLNLVGQYKQKYQQKFKGRVLNWYPLQGFAILNIKFNKISQQFKMDTVMATIMLNLESQKFISTINKVLSRTGLTLTQSTEQLELLQKEGLIRIQGSVRNTEDKKDLPIQLNFDYQPTKQSQIIDFTQRYLEQNFTQKTGHEQLKAQRKMMVEAFIVKVVKANKTLTLAELYEQITPMIQARGFIFNQKFVDNTFNGLIDKRFIRDLQNGSFMYLAS